MKETDQQNYEFDRIDDLIHSRVRLATMAYLSGAGTADFKAIKSAVKATDGNISVHLRKLEDAGYLVSIKQFNGRKPQTLYEMSDKGRSAWRQYLAHLSELLAE
jgi:DNA-binding MarR family transcriptional regulator